MFWKYITKLIKHENGSCDLEQSSGENHGTNGPQLHHKDSKKKYASMLIKREKALLTELNYKPVNRELHVG